MWGNLQMTSIPRAYRERSTVDVNQSVMLDLRRLPREELVRRLEELRQEQLGFTPSISEMPRSRH
jgi:hypothetical protein